MKVDEKLEELIKDIFAMPSPQWFSDKWSRHIVHWKERAEKWDKIYWELDDDEMPVTPERIAMVLNFVNDHFPDFDTPKEFEDTITEYIDWETELTEAEDKLEAIRKEVETGLKESKEYLDTHGKPEPHNVEMSRYWLEKGFYGIALELKKILEGSYFKENSE